MQDFIDDLDQMYARTRNFEHHGYKFVLTAQDPYGFWTARVLGVKKQPELLEQSFTSIHACQQVCIQWAESTDKIPVMDKADESPVEPIKYKKTRVNKPI